MEKRRGSFEIENHFEGRRLSVHSSWRMVLSGTALHGLFKIGQFNSSIKEEWCEANITDFQLSFIANKYIVLRKTTVHGHGDFACSSSLKRGMCVFKIKTLTQAAKICNTYADVCKAFVLTKDMSIRLVHQVKRPTYDSQAALFVKREYLNNQELASH